MAMGIITLGGVLLCFGITLAGEVNCPAGSYQDVPGSCLPCAPGSYSSTTDSTACTACSEGTYQPLNGSDHCLPCPVGTANPNTGMVSCKPCQSGTYNDQTESEDCLPCTPGLFSGAGAADCTPCPKGHFSEDFFSNSCAECPTGTLAPREGMSSCETCGRHTRMNSDQTECEVYCEAGFYRTDGQCAECPRGTYSTEENARECIACPAGHTTYRPHTDRCYGPSIKMTANNGNVLVRETAIPDLGQFTSHPNPWTAIVGDWEIYGKDYYRYETPLAYNFINHGESAKVQASSIKPLLMNKFCYSPRDNGYSYSGYRSVTGDGRTCKRWTISKNTPESNYSNNFCRNPDKDPRGPWCYAADGGQKVSCDIPRCVHDAECYVGRGVNYQGSVSTTEDGRQCKVWTDIESGENFCRNFPYVSVKMARPWCFIGRDKIPCTVAKCKRECGDPTLGTWGRFQAMNSGLCWDVAGNNETGRNIGANLAMGICEPPHKSTTDHVFKMDSDGFIVNQKSGYCVNLRGDRKTDNKVSYNVYPCQYNELTDQKFSVEWHPSDSCAFRLRNKETDKCVDAHGKADSDPGANLQQYDCKDSDKDDHWYYFLPNEDMMCRYTYHDHHDVSGPVPDTMGLFLTLAGAQAACSGLGGKCGGIVSDEMDLGDMYKLKTGSDVVPKGNFSAWIKGDCDDTRYNYFEQTFQSI